MGTHSGHGSKVCQFGTQHSRCRCPDDSVIWINCPTPTECDPDGKLAAYAPKHKKDVRSGHREIRIDP